MTTQQIADEILRHSAPEHRDLLLSALAKCRYHSDFAPLARCGWKLTGPRSTDSVRVWSPSPLLLALTARERALEDICRRLSLLCPSSEGLGGHAPVAAFIELGMAARATLDKCTR